MKTEKTNAAVTSASMTAEASVPLAHQPGQDATLLTESSSDRSIRAQQCLRLQRSREHAAHERRSRNPAQYLHYCNDHSSRPTQTPNAAHPERDRRAEQSTRHPEKRPSADRKREAKTQSSVQQRRRVGSDAGIKVRHYQRHCWQIGDLHAGESEEEEEDRAKELCEGGDKVVEEGGWEDAIE